MIEEYETVKDLGDHSSFTVVLIHVQDRSMSIFKKGTMKSWNRAIYELKNLIDEDIQNEKVNPQKKASVTSQVQGLYHSQKDHRFKSPRKKKSSRGSKSFSNENHVRELVKGEIQDKLLKTGWSGNKTQKVIMTPNMRALLDACINHEYPFPRNLPSTVRLAANGKIEGIDGLSRLCLTLGLDLLSISKENETLKRSLQELRVRYRNANNINRMQNANNGIGKSEREQSRGIEVGILKKEHRRGIEVGIQKKDHRRGIEVGIKEHPTTNNMNDRSLSNMIHSRYTNRFTVETNRSLELQIPPKDAVTDQVCTFEEVPPRDYNNFLKVSRKVMKVNPDPNFQIKAQPHRKLFVVRSKSFDKKSNGVMDRRSKDTLMIKLGLAKKKKHPQKSSNKKLKKHIRRSAVPPKEELPNRIKGGERHDHLIQSNRDHLIQSNRDHLIQSNRGNHSNTSPTSWDIRSIPPKEDMTSAALARIEKAVEVVNALKNEDEDEKPESILEKLQLKKEGPKKTYILSRDETETDPGDFVKKAYDVNELLLADGEQKNISPSEKTGGANSPGDVHWIPSAAGSKIRRKTIVERQKRVAETRRNYAEYERKMFHPPEQDDDESDIENEIDPRCNKVEIETYNYDRDLREIDSKLEKMKSEGEARKLMTDMQKQIAFSIAQKNKDDAEELFQEISIKLPENYTPLDGLRYEDVVKRKVKEEEELLAGEITNDEILTNIKETM